MDRIVLKNIALLSLLLGLFLGIIGAIPYIGGIALFALFMLSAPLVILLLIMAGKIDLTTVKDSIIQGFCSGFFVNITFSFAYCLITAIMFTIFNYTSNHILSSMIINSPIWLLIVVVIFIGILTATTNAFSGFLTYYIINLIRDIYESKHNK